MLHQMQKREQTISDPFPSSLKQAFFLAEVSLQQTCKCLAVASLVIEHYTHMRYFQEFSGLLKRLTQFFTQLLLLVFQLIQFTFFNFYLPTFNFNTYHRIVKNNSIYDTPFLFLH